MRVVEFREIGHPADVLSVQDLPSRQPGAGEARVKVLATPIHPADLMQISGQYGTLPELPSIPGAEGIGEVLEVGSAVETIKPGQPVLLSGVGGTWRDEVTANAASFIPAPPGNVEQLSMLAVNPMTAHLLLSNFVALGKGDWVVQSAANSAVGELVIQLAALRGINTVNVVRREELTSELRSLGGTVAIVDGPDLADRIEELADGASIKLALDSVGGSTFERLHASLGSGGTIVSYGNLSGQQPQLHLRSLITNDTVARGFWLAKWYRQARQQEQAAAFGALAPLVSSGALKTRIDSRFSLENIREAVIRASESGRNGKVLLTPQSQ